MVQEEEICLYQVLNVEENASCDEIKKNFHKLSLRHHPDRTDGIATDEVSAIIILGANPTITNPHSFDLLYFQYKRITEAYRILLNPSSRRVYDESGMVGIHSLGNRQPGPTAQFSETNQAIVITATHLIICISVLILGMVGIGAGIKKSGTIPFLFNSDFLKTLTIHQNQSEICKSQLDALSRCAKREIQQKGIIESLGTEIISLQRELERLQKENHIMKSANREQQEEIDRSENENHQLRKEKIRIRNYNTELELRLNNLTTENKHSESHGKLRVSEE